MALTKVLITVKTYPSLSQTYDELVCTAGFREDGSWIRIYPVPFRKLDYANRYEKWQWIEVDLVKNTSDFRPESYRPYSLESEIKILDKIDTHNSWAERKSIVFNNVHNNLSTLIEKAHSKDYRTSLGILKPTKIIDFVWEPVAREWDSKKLAQVIANQQQPSLFDIEETKQIFKVVEKLPYKFSYIFTTEDGKTRTLMIEDWELGALYWNCLKLSGGDESIACRKVKQKYFDEFVSKKDLHFFMGTTKVNHFKPSPFIIIGAFYPPKETHTQMSLF